MRSMVILGEIGPHWNKQKLAKRWKHIFEKEFFDKPARLSICKTQPKELQNDDNAKKCPHLNLK